MIPKTIHYCWFGGGKKNNVIDRCIDSWARMMPEWEIIEWTEENTLLNSTYLREAYAQGLWSKVANYVRLNVLDTYGGVYLDTDVEVRKNFESLLDDECFVGFQVEKERVDWVNNAVIGAMPGHHFLSACMRLTVNYFTSTGQFARSPTVTTQVLKQAGLRDYGLQIINSVTVYPTPYFYPYPWYADFSEDCVSERTYCVHHWEGSWLDR